MSRAASFKTKIAVLSIALIVVVAGFGGWAYANDLHNHKVTSVTNAQHQITQLSYQGQNGVTALSLLKKYATVVTKHYSFGDLVVSINGTSSSGSKYWTFYANGKQANVGAGAYTTKASDKITWKLQ